MFRYCGYPNCLHSKLKLYWLAYAIAATWLLNLSWMTYWSYSSLRSLHTPIASLCVPLGYRLTVATKATYRSSLPYACLFVRSHPFRLFAYSPAR